MAIPATEIAMYMRQFAGDIGRVKYSEDQILIALNLALRFLGEQSSRSKSHLWRDRKTDIVITDGVGTLPDDLVSVERVFGSGGNELLRIVDDTPSAGEYRLSGSSILTGESGVVLVYNGTHDEIASLASDIDLPPTFTLLLSRIGASALVGDYNGMMSISDYSTSNDLEPRREAIGENGGNV